MAFRLLEHTADVGIEAGGPDRETALAEAAHGLTAVLTGSDDLHRQAGEGNGVRQERSFFVEAPDLESLAVAFLSELLWLLEKDGLLWVGGGMRLSETQDGLRADVRCNMVPLESTHGGGVEVKAVTYHGLRFVPDGDGWSLRVILDL